MQIYYIIFICMIIHGTVRAASQDDSIPSLAAQCAAYLTGKKCPDAHTSHRRNRLHDDPEQQLEHTENDSYEHLLPQIELIKNELNAEHPQQIEQLELACRMIAQALLRAHNAGQKGALEKATTTTDLAAHLLLLQHPFWQSITHEIRAKSKTAQTPSYTADELDTHLPVKNDRKELLIKKLLELLEYDDIPVSRIRTEQEQKAIDLFNGAATSEIVTDVKFLRSRDKHEYLELEQAYGSVVMLYLKAHDLGHPKGLEKAEHIMRGNIFDRIISWKEKHLKEPYAYSSTIWEEINKRKHVDPAAPASSGYESSSV